MTTRGSRYKVNIREIRIDDILDVVPAWTALVSNSGNFNLLPHVGRLRGDEQFQSKAAPEFGCRISEWNYCWVCVRNDLRKRVRRMEIWFRFVDGREQQMAEKRFGIATLS